MRTSVTGKLNNTALPTSRPLAPLYEAIHNALQAIEDAANGAHEIEITIERLPEILEDDVARPTGLIIRDSGVGFNDDNATSFFTAESRYKAERGGKGNGRFLWLKAFSSVEVDSHFRGPDGIIRRRRFVFDRRDDQDVPAASKAIASRCGTTIKLVGMDERISKQLSKNLDWYADQIIAHFLPYFRSSGGPQILLRDGIQSRDLNSRFEETVAPNATPRTFKVDGHDFSLTGYRVNSPEVRENILVFAARGRAVKRERLAKYVPGLEKRVENEDDSSAAYCGFVEGARLDDMVRSDRFGFRDRRK